MAPQRFSILFTGLNRAMAVLGLTSRTSYLEVDADEVRVRMSWTFALSTPRSSIGAVEVDDRRVWGWGAHGWKGSWLINGSSSNIVRFSIEPPVRGRLLSVVPVTVREVRVSVEDPAAVIDALNGEHG